MLRRAQRITARRVHHDDAVSRRCVLVNIVRSNTGPDDRLQSAIPLERIGRNLHATPANRPFEPPQRFAQRVALQSGPYLILHARRSVEHLQTFGGERIKNNDAWHNLSLAYFAFNSRNSTMKSRNFSTPSTGIAL